MRRPSAISRRPTSPAARLHPDAFEASSGERRQL